MWNQSTPRSSRRELRIKMALVGDQRAVARSSQRDPSEPQRHGDFLGPKGPAGLPSNQKDQATPSLESCRNCFHFPSKPYNSLRSGGGAPPFFAGVFAVEVRQLLPSSSSWRLGQFRKSRRRIQQQHHLAGRTSDTSGRRGLVSTPGLSLWCL